MRGNQDASHHGAANHGGINWGLVAAGRFDLVAKLTGNRFGETNAASRVSYGAVGAASLLAAAELARRASSP